MNIAHPAVASSTRSSQFSPTAGLHADCPTTRTHPRIDLQSTKVGSSHDDPASTECVESALEVPASPISLGLCLMKWCSRQTSFAQYSLAVSWSMPEFPSWASSSGTVLPLTIQHLRRHPQDASDLSRLMAHWTELSQTSRSSSHGPDFDHGAKGSKGPEVCVAKGVHLPGKALLESCVLECLGDMNVLYVFHQTL